MKLHRNKKIAPRPAIPVPVCVHSTGTTPLQETRGERGETIRGAAGDRPRPTEPGLLYRVISDTIHNKGNAKKGRGCIFIPGNFTMQMNVTEIRMFGCSHLHHEIAPQTKNHTATERSTTDTGDPQHTGLEISSEGSARAILSTLVAAASIINVATAAFMENHRWDDVFRN